MRIQHELCSADKLDPRLRDVLTVPIVLSPEEYAAGRSDPPTPLDPDNVVIYGGEKLGDHNGGFDGKTFREYALDSASLQIDYMRTYSAYPADIIELLAAEAYAQINNRCDHSARALERLTLALTNRPPSEDAMEDMIDIIYRTRAGTATLAEQLRLIKEYPEIISIETSNTQTFVELEDDDEPVKNVMAMATRLRDEFHDAVVTLGSVIDQSESESELIPGIVVRKKVIAEVESVDSHTELVLKTPILAGITIDRRTLRLGATTYLRAHDRKDRIGYHDEDEDTQELLERLVHLPAEEARRLIGELASRQK